MWGGGRDLQRSHEANGHEISGTGILTRGFKHCQVTDLDVTDLGFPGPRIPFCATGALWGRVTPFSRSLCSASKQCFGVDRALSRGSEYRAPKTPSHPQRKPPLGTARRFPGLSIFFCGPHIAMKMVVVDLLLFPHRQVSDILTGCENRYDTLLFRAALSRNEVGTKSCLEFQMCLQKMLRNIPVILGSLLQAQTSPAKYPTLNCQQHGRKRQSQQASAGWDSRL